MAQLLSGYASLYHFARAHVLKRRRCEAVGKHAENGLRSPIAVSDRMIGAIALHHALCKLPRGRQ